MNEILKSMVRGLQRRVGNMIIRAVVLSTDDSGLVKRVKIQGRAGEVKDGIEYRLPYGFAMRVLPPGGDGKGAESVVIAVEPDYRVALPATDPRYEPSGLKDGEVCFYTDEDQSGGCRLHFERGRIIRIQCDQAIIEANSLARISGDVVEIHAASKLHFDVGGYGEDWVHSGGEFHIDTWKIGNVVPGTANNIQPPEHNK